MQLSKYQESILDWLKNGSGNGCCNAVAGSGKTTTLKLAGTALQEAGYKPSEIKIIVFGKANSQDLIKKFGEGWENSISTLHSAGWAICKANYGTGKIQSNKYRAIAQDLGFLPKPRNPARGSLHGIIKDDDFVKLLDLSRLTNLLDVRGGSVLDLCEHFEIDEPQDSDLVAEAIERCHRQGINQAIESSLFDFTDQIWLPVRMNLRSNGFKFVLVDECQDLNAVQLELACKLAGKDGRMLFVGDPRQAIMGFAGADCDSYRKILQRVEGLELPLSICYRCPGDVIKLVRREFPEIPIEPRDDAPNGEIRTLKEDDLDKHLTTGDMVIGRKTAPLVSLCIKLIGQGVKATVKGRDIGASVRKEIEGIEKTNIPYHQFFQAVTIYKQQRFEAFSYKENAEQLQDQLNDKIDALIAVKEANPRIMSYQGLAEALEELFSDDSSPITLSTIHRSKGLEAERVFIIRPNDLPMHWENQSDWQLEQEYNLLYVALTRTKQELFIVKYGKQALPSWADSLDDEIADDEPAYQPSALERLKARLEKQISLSNQAIRLTCYRR